MIDNGFNSTREISNMVKSNFGLDEKSFIILGVIAENGPLTSYQILEKGCSKSHNITRDEIRYRLPRTLKDFLIEKEGGKQRNTGRIHKFYHLTFKGLIASLARTSFEKNYIVKKYLSSLLKYANKLAIPEITIQLIKYNIALYLIKNVIDGLKLTEVNNIDDQIFKLNTHESRTEPSLRQKPISDKKLEKIEFEIRIRLHIIRQILNQSIKIVKSEQSTNNSKQQKNAYSSNPTNNFILNTLPDYVKYWFDYMQDTQFEEIDESEPHIRLENRNSQGIQIDIKTANKNAQDILNKLGIKAKLTDTDKPLLFL